jgi:hypothetical protein
MTFFPRAYYLDNADMATFILQTPKVGWTWKPVGITWHNTAIPNLAQWDAYPSAVRAAWGDNYDHMRKFSSGWHSGPHFCGAPDKSFALCDIRADGIHSTCFNRTHIGVETVGDFHSGSGGEDPHSGRGLASMTASANIIAAICKLMNWEPRKVINFHRQCTADHHACPGDLVTDEWAFQLVETRLAELNAGAPPADAPKPSDPIDLSTYAGVQRALNALGAKPPLDVDNEPGSLTEAAVEAFQRAHPPLVVDGDAGPKTKAAILAALSGDRA